MHFYGENYKAKCFETFNMTFRRPQRNALSEENLIERGLMKVSKF